LAHFVSAIDTRREFGGIETLISYGMSRRMPLVEHRFEEARNLCLRKLPQPHLNFMLGLELAIARILPSSSRAVRRAGQPRVLLTR
jgi:hypothetical protein